MNIKQIEELTLEGESTTLEFKTSTAKLNAIFKTVCAFLNGHGGTVLIGVNDKGKLMGQDVTDNTRREIAAEKKKLEPAAPVDITYIEFQAGKMLIVIHADVGEHLPYLYDGRAYQRDESTTTRMTQHFYEQLLVKRGQLNHSWEKAVVDDYHLDDLDHEEIYRTVMEGIAEKRIPPSIAKESEEKILRQLGLMNNGTLKRAAVILFAKEITPDYGQCWLKMARFRGRDKLGEFMDNQQIYCNVFRMLEEADNFLSRHLPIASYFKPDQFKRIDKPALPVLAVREALVNAICHKNYANQAGYISIAIFDDRIEIWNNGTLPDDLKIADLKRKHDSILRNQLIANVFYLRGYIEAWGTGTTKMIDICKQESIPAPSFAQRTGGLVVTFKFAEPIGITGKSSAVNQISLSARQQEILQILKNSKPLSANEIFDKMKQPPSLRTVKKDLLALKKFVLIEQEGSARSTRWKISQQ